MIAVYFSTTAIDIVMDIFEQSSSVPFDEPQELIFEPANVFPVPLLESCMAICLEYCLSEEQFPQVQVDYTEVRSEQTRDRILIEFSTTGTELFNGLNVWQIKCAFVQSFLTSESLTSESSINVYI